MNKLITAALLSGVVAASFLGAAPANATTSPAEICEALDESPTKGTITGIAIEEFAEGTSSDSLAMNFAVAAFTCAEHKALIVRVMNEFSEGDLS